MKIKLSDSIRAFRKAHSLTQQQLAEALGVTVGAVYKWEANLSTPDLSLLIELADLFDTSVDVLLGYEVKSSQQPRRKQRGIKLATLQSSGVFDPRGIRQISVQARLLGSLLAGINRL